jgi:flagellar biosynthesis/type III secretory pathway M-ring protein FliF/YscJ
VKHFSAAVFLASRMQGTGTNRVAQTRTKEELDKLKKIVQSALGIQEGTTARTISPSKNMRSTTKRARCRADSADRPKMAIRIQIAQTALYPFAG